VAGLAAGAAFWASRRARAGASRLAARSARPGAPRVVILGAGFGGITTAIELGRLARRGVELDVTLVDRVNYHLFTPMLYQVATGLVEPGHIEYPTRVMARDYGFRFREGEVEAIDLDQRHVVVGGARLPYDRLVIALGSVTNYFGNDSIERSAASLKTLADAVAIRNRVLDSLERADVETDVAARSGLLTVVVVGGGATGVELAGSLHSLIRSGLLPIYPSIDPREVRIILAEAGNGLLGGMDPWLGEEARRRLVQKGVEVWLDNSATRVTETGIAFKDGRFVASRTVVWAAGVRPSPLTAGLAVERGRDGRLLVDQQLRLPSHPEVFALGDCAWFSVPEEDDRPAPPNAQTAVRQAPVVAENVAASLHGAPLLSFQYESEGNLVSLGQGDGVAQIGSARLRGFPAWLAWRGFYLSQLMGFKNRLGVLVEWTSAYFGYRGTALLDVARPSAGPATAEAPPLSVEPERPPSAVVADAPTAPAAPARRSRPGDGRTTARVRRKPTAGPEEAGSDEGRS
jgi:NADH dehydrogenase